MIKGELGLVNMSRTPSAWKAALDHYRGAEGEIVEFQIPKNTSPAPEMVVDPVTASIDAIIGQLELPKSGPFGKFCATIGGPSIFSTEINFCRFIHF
jgi:hypothetical protein